MSNPKVKIILWLCVMILLGSGVWAWQVYSFRARPSTSQANEFPPHWKHDTVPFALPVTSYLGQGWNRALSRTLSAWTITGVMHLGTVPGVVRSSCYPLAVLLDTGMKVCSMNEDNGFLAIAAYMQGPGDPHIIGGIVILNDAYLNNPSSEYSTEAWKNKMLCRWVGWALGAATRFDAGSESSSCMNAHDDPRQIAAQQFPDGQDIRFMKLLYEGDESDARGLDYVHNLSAPILLADGQFGTLVQSEEYGQLVSEQFVLDLEGGYQVNTMVQRIVK